MFQGSDTATEIMVAPPAPVVSVEVVEEVLGIEPLYCRKVNNRYLFPAMQIRAYPHDLDTTEPEGYMLETLRKWTQAQADPRRREELLAWEGLEWIVQLLQTNPDEYGEFMDSDVWGKHHQTIVSVAALIKALVDRKGGTANE